MSNESEKLEQFRAAVFEEAEAEVKRIISEAKATKERILKSSNDDVLTESREQFKTEMRKIQQDYQKSISGKDFNIKKEILAYRNGKVDGFFKEIGEKLLEFSKSKEYADFLKRKLDAANGECPFTKDTVVYVKAGDEKLCKTLTDAAVEADKRIKLGGVAISYPENGLYIDNTLDKALDDEKTAFVDRAELRL